VGKLIAVQTVDPRLVAALQRQLQRRHGERVGWKLGVGDRERIGDHIAVGHLTSETRLEPGVSYRPVEGEDLYADAEIAVEIGPDGRIAAYGAALELVDLSSPPNTADDVVAANVFHRAVAFARTRSAKRPDGAEARLLVNGEVRDAGRSAHDIEAKVTAAGEILGAVGETLEPGDLVITGSVVQVAVAPGDHVEADLGALGRVSLRIGSPE
jgi:Fumarylacetoacetate (FAA) hydrolase family